MPFVNDEQLEKSRPSLQGSLIWHDQCPHFGCFDNLVVHIFDSECRDFCRRASRWLRRGIAVGAQIAILNVLRDAPIDDVGRPLLPKESLSKLV